MASVQRVTVIVETTDGTLRVTEDRPHPRGSNPQFLNQQLDAGLVTLQGRLARMIEADYPNQIEV